MENRITVNVMVMQDAPFPSLKWIWAIRERDDLSPNLRFVAYEIGSFADARGEVRPSLDRLKADTGISHATLKRLRAELVRLGYLELVRRGVGRGQASVYRLTFPTKKTAHAASDKTAHEPPIKRLTREPLSETGSEPSLREGLTTRCESETGQRPFPPSRLTRIHEHTTALVALSPAPKPCDCWDDPWRACGPECSANSRRLHEQMTKEGMTHA